MKYTSRIKEATALLADTVALLAAWQPAFDVETNFKIAQEHHLLGGSSRQRADQILRVIRQRYFAEREVGLALVKLVQGKAPDNWVKPLFYFFTAQSDPTLRDVVLEVINPRRQRGYPDVHLDEVVRHLRDWSRQGRTVRPWSEHTLHNVAWNIMGTLRDFDMLQGRKHKTLANPLLPLEAFTFLAFYLMAKARHGEVLLHAPEWRLFDLYPNEVELHLFEAHQNKLCHYEAAGSVVRLEFPVANLVEFADVLLERVGFAIRS